MGALPKAAEALSLIPPPLPRVKFLLMDARGSPEAETRWSDPITLHQGILGRGRSGSSLSLVDLPPSAKWSCSAASLPPTAMGLGAWWQCPNPTDPPHRKWCKGVGHVAESLALSIPKCLPTLGCPGPTQSWAETAFPSMGSQPAAQHCWVEKSQS